jgi:CHAT domain-containing protein
VRTYLDRDATEERAKAVNRSSRYVHFAAHGPLDKRFPLNSAIALTIPETLTEGHENGLLQVWKIFESVRVDADLVSGAVGVRERTRQGIGR